MIVGFALVVGAFGAVVWHLRTGENWTESTQFGAVLVPCWAGYAWVVRFGERRRERR
ncbi:MULTISPECIES: hypothetical protein [unclassified Streptomyces]|uniref:hypothetical protein n=1 Tax=unclassified Streptomyces TaxID=2593676 RepID=UPI0015E1ACEA|nr:hypothetical protein [Streptomyces sp. SM10]